MPEMYLSDRVPGGPRSRNQPSNAPCPVLWEVHPAPSIKLVYPVLDLSPWVGVHQWIAHPNDDSVTSTSAVL